MMNLSKNSKVSALWCYIVAIASLCSAATVIQAETSTNLNSGHYLGASAALGCTPNSTDPARGLTVGCQTGDIQQFESMGRQVSISSGTHVLSFTWLEISGFNGSYWSSTARFDGWDLSIGSLGEGTGGSGCGISIGGITLPCDIRSTNIVPLNDGTVLNVIHLNHTSPAGRNRAHVYKNLTPPYGDYSGYGGVSGTGRVPDSIWSNKLGFTPAESETYGWPKIDVQELGGQERRTHLIISHWSGISETEDVHNDAIYARRVTNASGVGEWEYVLTLPATRNYRSFLIAASKSSDNVAIAWSGPRGDGTELGAPIPRTTPGTNGKNDNDIYVMISNDGGTTWNPRMNITQRLDSLPGGWSPQSKLSLLWDQSDVLHVTWQSVRWLGYDAAPTKQARMYHWDHLSDEVTSAVTGDWVSPYCVGGYNQLSVDNPQLSECDGKLYLTYSAFAPPGRFDDCEERAFSGTPESYGSANGDIYLTVSSDGGASWDNPRSLTESYTPDCDTIPGGAKPDCHGDVWHSATRYGVDITGEDFAGIPDLSSNVGGYAGSEYMFVQYIADYQPGAAYLAEGGWTTNPVNAFRFGCVEPQSSPIFASSLAEGKSLQDSDSLLIATDSTFLWTIENIGSKDMTYTVNITTQTPSSNISLTGTPSTISAGTGALDSFYVTLNSTSLNSEQSLHAEIEVTGNFPGSPKTFTLDYLLYDQSCCELAGDANHDGSLNIADITFLIARIFASSPKPFCCEEADPNGSGTVNISDVTYLISHAFNNDVPPACGPVGMTCGN